MTRHAGWIGFFGAIVILASVTLFAAVRTMIDHSEPEPETSLVEVIVRGRVRQLPEQSLNDVLADARSDVARRRGETVERVRQRIDAEVDPIFTLALDNVPRFADWYYSLQGEYARYASALAGDLGVFLEDRMKEEIFAAGGIEARIDEKLQEINRYVARDLQDAARAVLQNLAEAVAGNGPVTDDRARIRLEGALDLDAVLAHSLAVTPNDVERQVVSGLAATGVGIAAGKGLGAVVVKKMVAKVAGTKTFQLAAVLLAKLATKMVAKGGGAAAAAAAGAAICSPGGPLALACGAAAGVVTWITVDKAFIELEEAIDRDEFERELRAAIVEERDALKRQLQDAYGNVIDAQYARMAEGLWRGSTAPDTDFIPANELPGRRHLRP